MAKLLTGSINLSKIKKEKLFTSEKTGDKFLNISIWVNDEIDKYGNIASIQQYLGKDAEKNYLGNLKEFKSETISNDIPENNSQIDDDSDDLPF